MFTILLVIIYISFISLGLPDALLGSAWPSMYQELQVPMVYAGIVSMIIAGGTIISSLQSDRLIKKLGTGVVTVISVCMTAIALFGFSTSNTFMMLCLWAIPYGLGAGSVDAALNNFVALHYKAKHMSWLHCFWGIGATLGPYIMGFYLTQGMKWHSGYRFIFIIQIVLTGILIFSMPLWKKSSTETKEKEESGKSLGMKTLIYLGITVGRFLCGFITMKLSDKNMVRFGQGIAVVGIMLLFLPIGNGVLYLAFVLIGMGCAPIYPSLLHATPDHFGKDLSQAIMGMQMACAYIGSTFIPPLVGFMVEHISIKLYPFCLLGIVLLMINMAEGLNKTNRKKRKVHI